MKQKNKADYYYKNTWGGGTHMYNQINGISNKKIETIYSSKEGSSFENQSKSVTIDLGSTSIADAKKMLKNSPHLKNITLTGGKVEDLLDDIEEYCPRVESLKIYDCYFNDYDSDEYDYNEDCRCCCDEDDYDLVFKNLKHLEIKDSKLSEDFQFMFMYSEIHAPKCEFVSFSGCYDQNGELSLPIFSESTHLKHLDLSNTQIEFFELCDIIAYQNTPKEINLTGTTIIELDDFDIIYFGLDEAKKGNEDLIASLKNTKLIGTTEQELTQKLRNMFQTLEKKVNQLNEFEIQELRNLAQILDNAFFAI